MSQSDGIIAGLELAGDVLEKALALVSQCASPWRSALGRLRTGANVDRATPALALGEARWFAPERVEAITRRGGEGRATVAWEVWLRVSDFHGRPMLRLLLPRGEDEPEPDRVFVVESPHGDCMAMWEPGAIFELIAAAKRRPLPRERHR